MQQKAATATRVHHLTQRLMRKEWGLPTHLSRQLFKTCIVPIMDYGSVIWWNQQKTLIQPLAKLQNKAARDIIGAFKTSPQAAVEIETGLLPTHLRLQQTVQRYATRILTLPQQHPLQQRAPYSFPPYLNSRAEEDIPHSFKLG